MELTTTFIELQTKGHTDIIDISDDLQKIVNGSGLREGNVTISVIGSTSGLTTIEYEPGLVNTDFPELLNKLAPYGIPYSHDNTWGDDNGAAHLRASLLGGSIVVPFLNGKLILGTWQQVIYIDFDTRPRSRKITVQVFGKYF